MITIKIDPTAVIAMMKQAEEVGFPCLWVQINPKRAETVLSWEVDCSERGVRITLHPTGQWTAELDLP